MPSVLVSAELRWFWDREPVEIRRWFDEACAPDGSHIAPGGGDVRTDRYAPLPGNEMGIKVRGGGRGVEIKGLLDELPSAGTAPFSGTVQRWSKWTSVDLALPATVNVHKKRRLRKLDLSGPAPREIALRSDEKPIADALPSAGCNIEYTEIALRNELISWWTLGFEAFGPSERVADLLQAAVCFYKPAPASEFADSRALSYPAWLASILPH